MADMPSNRRPPPRPSPPARSSSRDRRRSGSGSGSGVPSPRTPTFRTSSGGGGGGGDYLRPDPPTSPGQQQQQARVRANTGASTPPTLTTPPMRQRRSTGTGTVPGTGNGRRQRERAESDTNARSRNTNGTATAGIRRPELRTEQKEEKEEEELGYSDGEVGEEEGDEEDDVDYYALLNLPRDATKNQIVSAYHSFSRRFHPDKEPPDLRAAATKRQAQLTIAYETLVNPHKRVIYDQLGVRGLKERTWQVGVKAMTPQELKIWMQETMRKGRIEELDELVASTGRVVVKMDVSGCWFQQLVQETDEHGKIIRQTVHELPRFVMTNYLVKHSFRVPLETVGELLNAPLPSSFRELWPATEDEADKPPIPAAAAAAAAPSLTFDFSLGGAPSTSRKGRASLSVLANPTCGITLSHAFPRLLSSPDTPRTLASLLQGNEVTATVTALPSPVVLTQCSRAFGQNHLLVRSTFTSLPSVRPPIVECNLSRRLSLRHSFFIGLNTGPSLWPDSFASLLSLPPQGHIRSGLCTLGYTHHAHPAKPSPSSPQATKSKRTETYTAALTAGFLASGAQLRLIYGRTFYACSPLGTQQRSTHQPHSVGLRCSAEANLHITGVSSYTLKATRKVFSHTSLGLSLSIGGSTGSGGVVLGVVWSRLGQSFSLPVVLAPIAESHAIIAATTIPLGFYIAAELLWFRHADRTARQREAKRYRAQQKAKTLRRRKAAAEAVELMRASVERKVVAERENGGLVIVAASWGAKGKNSMTTTTTTTTMTTTSFDPKTMVDVTIPLQSLVEGGQVVISKGVDKSRLMGFYDPVPGTEKVLFVRYTFQGFMHEACVKGEQGFVAPQRSHLLGSGSGGGGGRG